MVKDKHCIIEFLRELHDKGSSDDKLKEKLAPDSVNLPISINHL